MPFNSKTDIDEYLKQLTLSPVNTSEANLDEAIVELIKHARKLSITNDVEHYFFLRVNQITNSLFLSGSASDNYNKLVKLTQNKLLKFEKSKCVKDDELFSIIKYSLSTKRQFVRANKAKLLRHLANTNVLSKVIMHDGSYELCLTGVHAKVFTNTTYFTSKNKELLCKCDVIFPQAFVMTNLSHEEKEIFRTSAEFEKINTLSDNGEIGEHVVTYIQERKGGAAEFPFSSTLAQRALENAGIL